MDIVESIQSSERPQLDVVISVDWEGSELQEENLQRIVRFKDQFHLPLYHFLNPAYYTSDATQSFTEVTDKIRSVLGDDDQCGLHLHPFRHLIEAAEIPFQDGPTFSRAKACRGRNEGMDVMLHAYPFEELEKLIGFSRDLLVSQGFDHLSGFRAGGWMADSTVYDCLKLNGFEFDSSSTMSALLNGSSWEGENLQRYIDILWPAIHLTSQTYSVSTSFGELKEVPNNFGAVDYWTDSGSEFFSTVAINEVLNRGRFLAVINSHQETACEHWDKIEDFISQLRSQAFNNNVKLNFTADMLQEQTLGPYAITYPY